MKSFTFDDQRRFARLSGDSNPLHMDLVGSRRLLFGEVVVHGAHTLLWCLDQVLGSLASERIVLKELKATFRSPLPLDMPLAIETVELDADGFTVRSTGSHCELAGRFDDTPDSNTADSNTADGDWWSVDVPTDSAELSCQDLSF
ncbi:MAG TPA: MaoC family dehydratase, partial [Thermoguttaceae bacterium]|nr:MaoC family dehydratase [Thermoguttaceae bacterium]